MPPTLDCCCDFGILHGSLRVQYQIQKLDTAENNRRQIWVRDHGATVNAVAVHPDGIVVGGEQGHDNYTTRKYSPDGVLIWSIDHGGIVRDVVVDSSGNIITTGDLVDGVTTRKYDSSGTELWTSAYSSQPGGGNKLWVDGSDDILETGWNDDPDTELMRKISGSDGSLIWLATHPNIGCLFGWDVMSDGTHIYFIKRTPDNFASGSPRVIQLDLDGNFVFDVDMDGGLGRAAKTGLCDATGHILVSHIPSESFGTIEQAYLSSTQWSENLFMIQPETVRKNASSGTFFMAGVKLDNEDQPIEPGNLIEFTEGEDGPNYLDSWTRGATINEIDFDGDVIYAVGTTAIETWD